MKFSSTAHFDKRPSADILVLPYWKGKKLPEGASKECAHFKELASGPIELNDFRGKEGELAWVYPSTSKEKRIALLGLGDQESVTAEKLRRAYGLLTKACLQKKCREVNIVIPEIPKLAGELLMQGLAEGILLSNYIFDKLKHDALKENPTILLRKANFINAPKNGLAYAEKYAGICTGVYLARDLVNGNADDVTPQYLADVAKKLEKEFPSALKATVFNKKRIEKEQMNLLLAVNRGSIREPVFVILEYKGDPKSRDHTVIVGKGITYDTGGLNIKTSGMETMKCDMAGAAAALGTILAAATTGLKRNFTAVFPATENQISATSYKPGDSYKSYSGKTVEVGNTDAEGRLILADALAYVSQKLKPTRIIDFATLTGAIEITLGSEAAGLFCNDDALAESLMKAGSETFERLWRLPLYEEYRDLLKSDIADIKNIGGRPASSITAALFLQEFVGQIPWAHCDIAGTAYIQESKRYLPKHATGIGVRLMISFLEALKH